MTGLLEELVEEGVVKGEALALDATFIKAWSRRNPAEDSHGLSDPEARVGRDGKSYFLGYKAHVAVDVESDMPVAVNVASANENEKKHAEELLGKVSEVVEEIKAVVADSQYSSQKVRGHIENVVELPVVVGTHPMPQNYIDAHEKAGDWDRDDAREFLKNVRGNPEAACKYDSTNPNFLKE